MLDAWTGKLLSAKPIVKVNWATSIDLHDWKGGRGPRFARRRKQWTVHNWWPMSYNAGTGLVYIPATDRKPNSHADVETGEWMGQTEGKLIAWDPVDQSERWSVEEEIATNGGVLSTAGNLVFQGQGNGEFAAFTADTGKKVWSIDTGSAIDSIPVTFSVNGEQYVLAAGRMGFRLAAVRSFVDDGNSDGRNADPLEFWRSSWAGMSRSPLRQTRAARSEATGTNRGCRDDQGRRAAV